MIYLYALSNDLYAITIAFLVQLKHCQVHFARECLRILSIFMVRELAEMRERRTNGRTGGGGAGANINLYLIYFLHMMNIIESREIVSLKCVAYEKESH